MRVVIQVITMSGQAVDGASWTLEMSNLTEGQIVSLSVPTNDMMLIKYIQNVSSNECNVDKNDEIFSLMLNCKIKSIRHMMDTSNLNVESMITLLPVNRLVEQTIVHIFNPSKSDSKFISMIRSHN